ncbi:Oxidoreductase, short chain dehydrogenase/reductase family [Pseudomonas amygdali pv. ulmi]|uniref:Oxidoreductase, short chain dehydrogenase/reductase family n=1 Tax=Pseudomonas amygdali pv. ulmi TaxID=251720 RepID=A0A3M4SUF7_PSEA0|nr:Oxidoreductase, short chain dehydrogenase/reductase family [Pseudomonas amygdali pv. ulmi]
MNEEYPKPPFASQPQEVPGLQGKMDPYPDCGEKSYKGSGRLQGKIALITGADSGIGRAVAIAFAREGAQVAISYLNEHEDAEETKRWVEEAGRKCLLLPGDLAQKQQCEDIVSKTVAEFGRIDVLVNNAAFQMNHETLEELSDEEWVKTFDINITAMFRICKAAVPHMPRGGSIINTSSVNSDMPKPTLLAYATTKGAIANFTGGLAQLLGDKGIRVNSVAPRPDLDATHPGDHDRRRRQKLRQRDPAGPSRSAGGSFAHLRFAGLGRSQLHFRLALCSDGRQADPVNS